MPDLISPDVLSDWLTAKPIDVNASTVEALMSDRLPELYTQLERQITRAMPLELFTRPKLGSAALLKDDHFRAHMTGLESALKDARGHTERKAKSSKNDFAGVYVFMSSEPSSVPFYVGITRTVLNRIRNNHIGGKSHNTATLRFQLMRSLATQVTHRRADLSFDSPEAEAVDNRMEHDLIFYQFSRSKVERGDFSHFLSLYAPDKLPAGRRLRDLMNGIVFGIEGWDNDPREIHTIPEIRRFYSTFHDAWPYWFYFCNLDVDTLRAMTMCCLPSINVMQVAGQNQVSVTCEPIDLLNFIKRDFLPMNLICERAGMFEDRILDRTKALFEYFNMPFEAELLPVKRF